MESIAGKYRLQISTQIIVQDPQQHTRIWVH